MDSPPTMRMFRVLTVEDRTRIETLDDVMGWGVEFPTGRCYADWNREAFPEEDRLEHDHVSMYGCLADVEQGTGGEIDIFAEHVVWE